MGAQDTVPEAISKRHRVITLSEGGSFTVTRWSIAKTMLMSSWLAKAVKDMPGVEKAIEGVSPMELGTKLVDLLGDKLVDFLGMSVDPADKATVLDLPADDALEVFQAIVELNVTDKLLKKVKELSGLFRSKFLPVNGKNT